MSFHVVMRNCVIILTFSPPFQIVFLPMFSFTAASALKGLALMDAVGMALRWRFFDHAAHLSGLVFGVAYVK